MKKKKKFNLSTTFDSILNSILEKIKINKENKIENMIITSKLSENFIKGKIIEDKKKNYVSKIPLKIEKEVLKPKILNVGIGGNQYTGKSAFVRRLVENEYIEQAPFDACPTPYRKIIKLPKGNEFDVKIVDFVGQEVFHYCNSYYYNKMDGFIIMYDITNRESLENIHYWIRNFQIYNVPIIIIGNKCDCEEERKISKKEGEEFSQENNLHFYESSCKNNINIYEPIYDLIEQIVKNPKPKISE